MPTSDECLLKHAYRGDSGALEELLTRHHRDLHWLLERMVGHGAIARELLEELYAAAFLTIRTSSARLDATRGPVKGYLLALAGRLAHEWLTGRLDLSHHEA
jgi:DNA-directed RNA polymerase specialized sigma24 family protein